MFYPDVETMVSQLIGGEEMSASVHGNTAYRLMRIYARSNRPPCSCLKMPLEDPRFQETVAALADEIDWDQKFVFQMIQDLREDRDDLYEQFPTICEDLALRMFRCFMKTQRHEPFESIVTMLSAGISDRGVERDAIFSLVSSEMNHLLHEEIQVQVVN